MVELTDKLVTREQRRAEGTAAANPERPVARVPGKLPRVVLAQGLLALIAEFIQGEVKRNGPQVETGGMLVGQFEQCEGQSVFRLSDFIEAGPRAELSSDSVLFDHEHQAERLAQLRLSNPRLGNMGCLHLHPGKMDECSIGDQLADREAVKASDTQALVFAIVTVNNRAHDPLSLHYRNVKFDFFLMAQQTGLEYVHVRPRSESVGEGRARRGQGRVRLNGGVELGWHHTKLTGLLGDKRRLVAEVRAMEERYGDRAVLRYQRNLLFWEYTVVESGRRFPVEIRYPRRYPMEPPRIISRLPLPPSPHQLVGHELCWIDRSAMGDWNPARDTASTCVTAAHRWFGCLLVYLTLGTWPEEANDAPIHATAA